MGNVHAQFDSNANLFISLSNDHPGSLGSATNGGSNNWRTIFSEIECREARA